MAYDAYDALDVLDALEFSSNLSLSARMPNPLFLLLTPPQILKTRVRPKFWKICGWPI